MIPHYSLGWLYCSQPCLLVCSHNVCCMCQPPIEPEPPSLLLRISLSCALLRCILSLALCLICGPHSQESLGDLPPHFPGCYSALAPNECVSLCRLCKEFLHTGKFTWPEVAPAPVPGAPFVERLLANLRRRLPLSLRVSALCPPSSLTPGVRVSLPTALHHGPPFVRCQGCCGWLSSGLLACILWRLPFCCRRIVTRRSTTS